MKISATCIKTRTAPCVSVEAIDGVAVVTPQEPVPVLSAGTVVATDASKNEADLERFDGVGGELADVVVLVPRGP